MRLFVERARDVQPDFRLTAANSLAVTAICRRLDALPLALELAAPWIKVLTAEDLLRRLTQDVLLATAGPRDLPERQRTINATVAWSYQLLPPTNSECSVVWRAARAVSDRGSGGGPWRGPGCSLRERRSPPRACGLIDKSLLLRAGTSVVKRPLYQMLENRAGCSRRTRSP